MSRRGGRSVNHGHDAYQALRFPAFMKFLAGSSLVWLGTSAQTLAIGWEVYSRTDQALSLGMVGLVQAVPMFLFTLPARLKRLS